MLVDVTVKNAKADQFSRRVGRVYAFKKALRQLFDNKEWRENYKLGTREYKQFVKDFKEQCSSSKDLIV